MGSLGFAPLVPWYLIAVPGLAAVILVAVGAARRSPGTAFRAVALAALVLAAIAFFDPKLLATPAQRNLVTGIVAGVALGGLVVAWLVDKIIRSQAEQTAQRRLAAAQPDVLFVAFGHPRQDFWIDRHRRELHAAVALGVGGAFDFVAGVAQRAPLWLQRLGLEWLQRLVKEPWRWRRMRDFCAKTAVAQGYRTWRRSSFGPRRPARLPRRDAASAVSPFTDRLQARCSCPLRPSDPVRAPAPPPSLDLVSYLT